MTRHVAILIETSSSWGKGLVEGIGEYCRSLDRPWTFFVEPRGKYERLLLPDNWTGDGVIARVTHEALAKQLLERKLPAVNVSWYRFGDGLIPRVTADESQAGRVAAEHFLERGYRRFAYCGSPRRPGYVDRFGEAFQETLARLDHPCCVYDSEGVDDGTDWFGRLRHLAGWLHTLPPPTGLLTFDDVTGRQVAEACRYVGLSVPADLAILGGEQDELFSGFSDPPLSSIDHNPAVVGYHAAKTLDSLMQGEAPPERPLLIPVAGVKQRSSTDRFAVKDDQIRAILDFLHDRLAAGVQVATALKTFALSRRTLEIRFKEALGISPAEALREMRIQKCKRLLVSGDLSLQSIATECGFENPETMSRTFRRVVGIPPSRYREQYRLPADGPSGRSATVAR